MGQWVAWLGQGGRAGYFQAALLRAAFLSPTARFAQFFATPCGRSEQFLRFLHYKAQFFVFQVR